MPFSEVGKWDFVLWEWDSSKKNNRKMGMHCLVSNREGLGTSLQIMGFATIDSHGQKEHNEIHKIPKLSVNQASFH